MDTIVIIENEKDNHELVDYMNKHEIFVYSSAYYTYRDLFKNLGIAYIRIDLERKDIGFMPEHDDNEDKSGLDWYKENFPETEILTFKVFKDKYIMNKEVRNVAIDLKIAKEWYNSGNESLKAVALQAFSKDELEIITYKDVCNKLFKDEPFYTNEYGKIMKFVGDASKMGFCDANNATTEKQLEKLLAINKLMNVAKYLNGDWKPDWSDYSSKYYIFVNKNYIQIGSRNSNSGNVFFKSEKLAKQAIEILGEDVIKLALTSDY